MDWLNTFDSHVLNRREPFTCTRVEPGGPYTEVINPVTGVRLRNIHSTNPKLVGDIYRCAPYQRWSATGSGYTPTHRRGYNGNLTEVYSAYPPYTDFVVFGNPPSGWTNLDNAAITECLLRLSSAKVQLANDLIEAKKTFNLFADTVKGAAQFLLDLRRGRWGNLIAHTHPSKLSKNAAARWLEYVYAWKPLASEVYSAQELVKSHANTTKVVRVVRQKKEKGLPLPSGSGGALWYDLQSPIECEYSSKVVLYASMSNKYINMAKDWGCYNPASIAWEAVPYSFVVDWFLPVGNVLEAWTASDGYSFLTGCKTRRVAGSGSPSWVSQSGHFYWNEPIIEQRSTAAIELKSMDRIQYSDFPGPMLYTKSPLSTSHAANALALLRQIHK